MAHVLHQCKTVCSWRVELLQSRGWQSGPATLSRRYQSDLDLTHLRLRQPASVSLRVKLQIANMLSSLSCVESKSCCSVYLKFRLGY